MRHRLPAHVEPQVIYLRAAFVVIDVRVPDDEVIEVRAPLRPHLLLKGLVRPAERQGVVELVVVFLGGLVVVVDGLAVNGKVASDTRPDVWGPGLQ